MYFADPKIWRNAVKAGLGENLDGFKVIYVWTCGQDESTYQRGQAPVAKCQRGRNRVPDDGMFRVSVGPIPGPPSIGNIDWPPSPRNSDVLWLYEWR
ncbi:unnamed protein product, partial [Clonostachys solani]